MEIVSFISFLCLTASQKWEVRKAVVRRVKSGESVAAVARSVPFSVRTVYRWMARYSLGGWSGLKNRKKSGRPRKWTEEHAEWIYRTVVDKTPQQLKFEFALWTVNRLRQAFYDEFKVQLSATTVRRILKTLKLSPQRPKRRAVKYCPQQVKRWKTKTFPKIAKKARKAGALIVFADESGLDSQCVYGRTWGPVGQTPVVRVANSKFRLSMLAAISPDGEMYFVVREGTTTSQTFIEFLEKIQQETDRKILLVVDSASIHKAGIVQEWAEENQARCEIYYQPTYSPEVNPVELLWALIKRTVSQQVSRTKAQLRANLEAALKELQETPDKVRTFFKEKDCAYILG